MSDFIFIRYPYSYVYGVRLLSERYRCNGYGEKKPPNHADEVWIIIANLKGGEKNKTRIFSYVYMYTGGSRLILGTGLETVHEKRNRHRRRGESSTARLSPPACPLEASWLFRFGFFSISLSLSFSLPVSLSLLRSLSLSLSLRVCLSLPGRGPRKQASILGFSLK